MSTAQEMKTAEWWIKQIEENKAPWQREWKEGHAGGFLPFNLVSGRTYRGYNPMTLLAVQEERGFQSNGWVTYKQAAALGGQVRRGEKATAIHFYMPTTYMKQQEDGSQLETEGAVKKMAFVFNVDQIDGLPELEALVPLSEAERHAECEQLMSQSEAPIFFDGGSRAYYRPSTDSIHLPAREAFVSQEALYSVALHEMGHSTGHKKRLDRDLSGKFGTEQYAFEELCAEISSCLMSSRLGIAHNPAQHVAYVQSWIKLVKEDPRAIHKACAQAERIFDYLGVVERQRSPMQAKEQEQGMDQAQDPKRAGGKSSSRPVAAQSQVDKDIDRLFQQVIDQGRAYAAQNGVTVEFDVDGWWYAGGPAVEPEGRGGFITKNDAYKHLGLTYGLQIEPVAQGRHEVSQSKQREEVQEVELSR